MILPVLVRGSFDLLGGESVSNEPVKMILVISSVWFQCQTFSLWIMIEHSFKAEIMPELSSRKVFELS